MQHDAYRVTQRLLMTVAGEMTAALFDGKVEQAIGLHRVLCDLEWDWKAQHGEA